MSVEQSHSSLHLYNSLTKREEEFTPIADRTVTMYTCGPTVYGRPHIGNYSSFLMADLLRRYLEVKGYEVRHVKNITDVGHLVADQDEGEDKIEKQAKEEKGSVTMQSVLDIARTYESQYLDDEKTLNMLEPMSRPRATEYIEQMKEMIETLLQKKFAYVTEDGIYFDVTRFPSYGQLSGNTLQNIESGARVAVNEEKRHPADFALWKFCVGANAHHVLRWSSPRGPEGQEYPEGFPGWHIECSAMSRALLGDQIDIHTGGEDNIFPHHECEIAQSESVTGAHPFVRTWLHKRRIDLEGEKMSKSLGNVLTIPNILDRGYDAQDLRYYLLSVHYRTNLKFSWKGMDDAKKARRKITEWMEEVRLWKGTDGTEGTEVQQWRNKFMDAMDSDLNTPGALGVIFDLMSWSRNQQGFTDEGLASLQSLIDDIKETFGCFESSVEKIPADVQSLLDERAAARASKNFAESDRLRDEIAKLGFEVKDTKDGQSVKKI
ncbi:MAG TPA: cysteine--tRNA ligase [Candidatus Peribacteraceae bacterium]|nr:cysteine--tRNA ligase [Candidatus Peribacteraceae bacterium]